jgi:DNA-binding NarL/FixJ family response regulator
VTPRRVLLIDDHDHTRFGLRRLLELRGHTVEEADDGRDGVRKALAWKPDVALVDLEWLTCQVAGQREERGGLPAGEGCQRPTAGRRALRVEELGVGD